MPRKKELSWSDETGRDLVQVIEEVSLCYSAPRRSFARRATCYGAAWRPMMLPYQNSTLVIHGKIHGTAPLFRLFASIHCPVACSVPFAFFRVLSSSTKGSAAAEAAACSTTVATRFAVPTWDLIGYAGVVVTALSANKYDEGQRHVQQISIEDESSQKQSQWCQEPIKLVRKFGFTRHPSIRYRQGMLP